MNPKDRAERLTDLWVTHHSAILAYARRRIDDAGAQEVASETFAVAWRRLEDVPRDARPWLFTVARNVLMTHQRTSGRWMSLARHLATLPICDAASAEDEGGTRVDWMRAWALLDEGEREVLALVGWDGLSASEAAKVLGMSRAALSMRLTRARRHFAALAEGSEDLHLQHKAPGPREPALHPAAAAPPGP